MICNQCGNQAADGSTACPFCGAQLTPVQPAAPAFQQPAPAPVFQQPAPAPAYGQPAPSYGKPASGGLGGLADTIVEKTKGLPVRTIAKAALILGLISFILPFFSIGIDTDYIEGTAKKAGSLIGVDVGDMDELDEVEDLRWGGYSGFNAMFGKLNPTKVYGIDEDDAEELGDEITENLDDLADGINLSLWISFLCGAGAIAVLFVFDQQQDKKSLISAGLSIASVLFALLGRIRFMSNVSFIPEDYRDNEFAELGYAAMRKMFESHIKWGFVLCMLFLLAGTAACAVDYLANGKRPVFLGGKPASFPTAGGYPQAPVGGFPQAPVNGYQAPVNPYPTAGTPQQPVSPVQPAANPADPFGSTPPQPPVQ